MTEATWMEGYEVDHLLRQLGTGASPRKLRLFLVECARRVLPKSPDEDMLIALATAESFADGAASKRDLTRARTALKTHHAARVARRGLLYTSHIRSVPAWHATREQIARGAAEGAGCCAWSSTRAIRFGHVSMTYPEDELRAQADLLRDIFGNPFRPVAFDPRWRTTDVVALARAIYDDRAFDRLPLLADALMDAGCDDEQVIGHCRRDGPHVRGCWVVDLVLEKG